MTKKKQADWEKRFDEKFGSGIETKSPIAIDAVGEYAEVYLDDIKQFIKQELKRERERLRKKLERVCQEPFDMAIGDSKDFERGFKQGFEVCWNKMLDATDNLKEGKK